MLKKTIKYTDYNGVERNEDFYFNLNKAELMEMEMMTPGGMADMIKNIVKAQDTPSIMKIFKEIITKSYGEKSADGKRFIKSKELTDAFTQTEAYAQLFTELATNDVEAAKFIRGIVPGDIDISDEKIKEELKRLDVEVPAIDTSVEVENTENK
jgi:hypothetical protein